MIDRIVSLIVEFAYLFRVVSVVHAYQGAVVLRLGRYHRTLGPGWHWVLPLRLEEVLTETVTPQTTNLPSQTLTTSDGVTITVSAIVTWRVSNLRRLLLESAGHEEAMHDTTLGIISRGVVAVPWSDVVTDEWLATVRSDVRTRARKWGIRVLDVQIQDLCRTRTLRLLGMV